ncbi:amidohydrolase family protein [Modicisalibacter coralii]|uniref:amidohydrolase family protein n=1 Tax=Modicisalibacter coralii TaxID=2304602 RepID=UPI00100BABAB|nr:amidohydrolase family protein [Halomonas coralii]
MHRPDIPGPNPAPRTPHQALPAGACDCHAHLFGPATRYPYHPDRGYTPPDASAEAYQRLLTTLGFERAVLVQPSVYGTDNRRLLDALREAREAGVERRGIAVVDASVTDAQLRDMHDLGVRGIRVNLLFPGGVDFRAIRALGERIAELGWHVQCLVDVSTVGDLRAILEPLPVPRVIDHMGHVPTPKGIGDPGFESLLSLLAEGRTWVKLSGPDRVTALGAAAPPYSDVDPFLQALVATNPERCVFGTDWPHVKLPGAMPDDGDLVDELLRLVPDTATRDRILVHNPARLYGF